MRQSAVNEWRSFARTVTQGPERTITSPARPSLRRAMVLLALIGATLAVTAPSGATTTKSSRELVPPALTSCTGSIRPPSRPEQATEPSS